MTTLSIGAYSILVLGLLILVIPVASAPGTKASARAVKPKPTGRYAEGLPVPEMRDSDWSYIRLYHSLVDAPSEGFARIEVSANDVRNLLQRLKSQGQPGPR